MYFLKTVGTNKVPDFVQIRDNNYALIEQIKFSSLEKKVKELLKNPPSGFPHIKKIVDVDGVRIIFDDGWGLVRASNTTPVLVTRFESTDEIKTKEYEQKINTLIKKAKEELE